MGILSVRAQYWATILFNSQAPNLQSQGPVNELVLFHPDMKIDRVACHQRVGFSHSKMKETLSFGLKI